MPTTPWHYSTLQAIPHLKKRCGIYTCPNETELVLVEREDQGGSASMLTITMQSLQMQLIQKRQPSGPLKPPFCYAQVDINVIAMDGFMNVGHLRPLGTD